MSTEREALTDLLRSNEMRPSCQAGMVTRCLCQGCATSRARAALVQPVAAEPFTYLVERSAFRVSPHGQDAESNEWLEEAKPDEPGAFPVYRHPPPTPA